MKNLPNDWSKNQNVVQATEVFAQAQPIKANKATPKGFIGFKMVFGFILIWAGLVGLAFIFPDSWVGWLWLPAPFAAGLIGAMYSMFHNPVYIVNTGYEGSKVTEPSGTHPVSMWNTHD